MCHSKATYNGLKKGLYCLDCRNFSHHLFKDTQELSNWLCLNGRQGCKYSEKWEEKIEDEGGVFLYWCKKQTPIKPVTRNFYQKKIITKTCKFFGEKKCL